MVTFTAPEELRRFIRSHQKIAYKGLFDTSSATLKKLLTDEKYIGGDLPGFFGVLHTWGRQLEYHPHIHYIIPGGSFDKKCGFWRPSQRDFYLPIWALSNMFREKFKSAMIKAGLYDQINPIVWKLDWNVNCQAVGSSQGSLKYLAPYVFKVAISNIKAAIERSLDYFVKEQPPPEKKENRHPYCPHCKGKLVFWYSLCACEIWNPG